MQFDKIVYYMFAGIFQVAAAGFFTLARTGDEALFGDWDGDE